MLPAWTARYVGLPFLEGGRAADLKEARRDGLDCFGLIQLVYREQYHRELPDYAGPVWRVGADRVKLGHAISEEMARYKPVPEGHERAGDGILLRMAGSPGHVALVLEPGTMLHIEHGCDSVVENYRTFLWQRRVLGFYRYERS